VKLVRVTLLMSALALVGACSGHASTQRPTLAALPSIAVPSVAIRSIAPISVAPPSQPAGSGGLPSADELCSLLTSVDWSTFQLQAKAQPTVNTDGPGSAYCTWTDASGAQGGLELDAFVDPTPSVAEDTYTTAADVLGGQPVDLPGVDSALINPNINGTYGAILARAGRFTYSVSLPASAGSQVQLESLAGLVLSRAQQYK